ncbi:unnamed protein product [Miscanthus lutarioriparius]|uniref:Uncharacterized protein n=1 Tax=Miscanthus lutarioriparius TaxID=422564 RepID=A0A811P1U0_9POAL|nr:unnamed protein product [Miscanthus lutarioriparius]
MDLHHIEDVRARDHQHQLVLRERGRRIKAAAELGLARSSASRGRQWGRALGRRRRALVVPPEEETSSTGKRQAPKEATPPLQGRRDHGDEEGDDDEVVVEEKVALLRQLVPAGEDMAVEGLLEETAGYIAALKAQVGVMRTLTCLLLSGSDLDAVLRPQPAAGVLTPEKAM